MHARTSELGSGPSVTQGIPRAVTLTELLAGQAAHSADATAVEDSYGNALTYRELSDLSGRIAARLRGLGVVRGDRVGICMPKCVNAVACIHGTLKVGAAYVPVDYSSPPERNRFIFTNCRAKVICTDEPRAATFEPLAASRDPSHVCVFPGQAPSGVGAPWLDESISAHHHVITPSPTDLAYILYTSGSTGVPKGVMHTHASAMSFINWAADTLRPTPEDRFSSHAPFHFDLSILDLYVPLTAGASVVVIGEELGKQPHELAGFIADQMITVWYSVPSILALLVQFGKLDDKDYSELRTVCFAGEVFPIKHLRDLLATWPGKDYYNLYGPTETNVCTFHQVQPEDHYRTTPLPIGRLCSNARGLIVDDVGGGFKRVRPGEEGMLYVHCSGPTMLGYWSDSERTNASIRVDANGERWYRTGDLVVDDGGGVLTFVGRRDRMVKRHGYRIELGEIEAGLYKLEGVDEAAAVAVDSPAGEGKIIIAFLSMKPGEKPPGIIALKQFCAKNLPSYMSPDRLTVLERLPRTSTDKVNYPELARLAGA
jgi:amino acid adenylation domain-containing protein